MIAMTFDEWAAKYQPGERITFLHDPEVRAADPLTVWTEVESDGQSAITNGYMRVNREAHYICAVPFNPDEVIGVELS